MSQANEQNPIPHAFHRIMNHFTGKPTRDALDPQNFHACYRFCERICNGDIRDENIPHPSAFGPEPTKEGIAELLDPVKLKLLRAALSFFDEKVERALCFFARSQALTFCFQNRDLIDQLSAGRTFHTVTGRDAMILAAAITPMDDEDCFDARQFAGNFAFFSGSLAIEPELN
jgi:hypothetical protein